MHRMLLPGSWQSARMDWRSWPLLRPRRWSHSSQHACGRACPGARSANPKLSFVHCISKSPSVKICLA